MNALAVVVLVGVTWYYARTTTKILDESKRMREAAEKQAAASQSQASAASATLSHLRQQVSDLQHLGASIVRMTIDKLVRSIDDWKKLDIKGNYVSSGAFPSPDNLLPENEHDVLEHARRVSDATANWLNEAFSDLRSAQVQIQTLIRSHDAKTTSAAFFNPSKYDPNPYLTSAFQKLGQARDELEKSLSRY